MSELDPTADVPAVGGGDASSSQTDDAHAWEVAREALTMALYVSLSLLAVIVAMPTPAEDNRFSAGALIMVTGFGLVLAHHVAFRLSSRLINEGLLTPESRDAMKAQALGGIPVAILAAIPVFAFGESPGEEITEVLLVAFVAIVGYRSARRRTSAVRSLIYVAGLIVVVSFVLVVKLFAGH